jgi:kinesin family protein C2/C3
MNQGGNVISADSADWAVQQLSRGNWLYRVGFSDAAMVKRYFWITEDQRELRWAESRDNSRPLSVILEDVIGMTFGPETTAFSRLVSLQPDAILPWKCFSLIFVGRTLDLCCLQDDADKWFISLQQIICSKGFMLFPRLSRSEIVFRKVMMKIRFKASYMKRTLSEHFRLTLYECWTRLNQPLFISRELVSSSREKAARSRLELDALRLDVERMQDEQVSVLQEGIFDIIRHVVSLRPQVRPDQALKNELDKERAERKKLHNELMNLKGNIRVFTRIRPILEWENHNGSTCAVSAKSNDTITVYNEFDARKRTFEFDHVFYPDATQEHVFTEVVPFIRSFLDGYNVSLLAYGVTNSGKTYTMQGTIDMPGITVRSLELIFSSTPEVVTLSCVQIYNETVFDLLNDMTVLELRGESFEAENVTQVVVNSFEAAQTVMKTAAQKRSTNSTKLNQESSRSHLVVTVRRGGTKLNLVDLAGSENVARSGATGPILQEAKYINRSLSALGDVIHGLIAHRGKSHVPFRNSKLTMLLRDSLQGNAKTVMIVQVSPCQADVVETLSSLQFASRARTVELGKPKPISETYSPVRE